MTYEYQPHIRFTGPAGPPVDYDLTTLETLTIAQPDWEPIILERELLDYSFVTEPEGWRVSAHIELEVTPGSASDTTIKEIRRLAMRPDQSLELSMDGVLYRVAHLVAAPRRAMKRNVGSIYALDLVCEKILHPDFVPPETQESPPIMTGW